MRKKKINLVGLSKSMPKRIKKGSLLYKKRQAMRREYNRLYKQMQKFDQPVGSYKTVSLTKRDVENLRSRVATVKEYNKIYGRFRRSVEGFNEKYFEDVKLRNPHNLKNTRTLENLKREYERWKNERKKYVRSLPQEVKIIAKNIEDLYKEIDEKIEQRAVDFSHREILEERKNRTYHKIRKELTVKMAEKVIRCKRIRHDWKFFVFNIDRYIFYSGQDAPSVRAEAYALFVAILTNKAMGRGLNDDNNESFEEYKKSSELMLASPEYDSVYGKE